MKCGVLFPASAVLLAVTLLSGSSRGQEPTAADQSPLTQDPLTPSSAPSAQGRTSATVEPPATKAAPPANTVEVEALDKLTRISKLDKVWINPKRKYVVVEGEIVLVDGQLELFACPQGTKEHESIVAVDSRAFIVHTALLAVGARSGHPVQFTPVYLIPTGDVIDVYVHWTDKEGKKHRVRAQEMVRHITSKKAMQHDWVFGGSGFWVDETTNEKRYLGEGGELICVSNFPSATIDVQVKSSQGNDSLLFEAFTENIPPRGTKVYLVLVPRKQERSKPNQPAGTGEASAESTEGSGEPVGVPEEAAPSEASSP
jgi:hypothetical protein